MIQITQNNSKNCIEVKSPRLEFEFGSTGTTEYIEFNGSGRFHSLILEISDFTTATTATLSILNSEGNEIYNSGAKAKDNKYFITLDRIVAEKGGKLQIDLDVDAGGEGGTVYLTFYLMGI